MKKEFFLTALKLRCNDVNVIYLIIDSLCYERLNSLKEHFGEGCFLNQLAQKGISFENMYSQASYTEAAAQAMYCGQKTLDKNGHLMRFKDADWTVFERAKQHGKETFYSNVLLQLYTSSTKRGVDKYYYNNGFEIGGLWNYRLSYYKDLYTKGIITKKDYEIIVDILDENFGEWKGFFESLLNKGPDTKLLLSKYCFYDVETNSRLLNDEYSRYCENKIKYIDELLVQGTQHNLFKIEAYTQNDKISDEFKKEIWFENKKTIAKIKRTQFLRNLINFLFDKASIAETKKVMKSKNLRNLKIYLANEFLFLNPQLLHKNQFLHYDGYKVAPSIETFINSFCEWVEQKEPKDYFACIHVDDVHHTETFFTYDSEDKKTIDLDFSEAKRLCSQLSSKFKGPLLYDLGLFYVSRKIEQLYNFIKSRGELDNTLFVITSDHGFSYQGTPTREKNVSTFYRENYHIPAIFYHEGIKPCVVKEYYNSYQIPNILFDLIHKKDIEAGNSYATIEYMGSGCPDVLRKKIKLAYHDNEIMICGDFHLLEEPKIEDCLIYDLINDPKQSEPLAYKSIKTNDKLAQKVNGYFELIKVRLLIIKKENSKWIY